MAILPEAPPPADTLEGVRGQQDEEIRLGRREIYVAYRSGTARSKRRIPAAAMGTARNINTIAKLRAMTDVE